MHTFLTHKYAKLAWIDFLIDILSVWGQRILYLVTRYQTYNVNIYPIYIELAISAIIKIRE